MPTLAFLGATGGCAGHCLAAALQSNHYTCRALARNPASLLTSLEAKGVSADELKRLTIIKGNAKDITAVKALLSTKSDSKPSFISQRSWTSRSSRSSPRSSPPSSPGEQQSSGDVVDTIFFGIGAAPKFQWRWNPITLDDTRVCETSMSVVLQALGALLVSGSSKPKIVAISTTGITSGPEDVPLLLRPLYHWILAVPHMDKRAMEALLWAETKRERKERVTDAFVIVRPTLLTNGEKGVDSVRWGGEGSPAVGWSVGRKDVGEWIFDMVIERGWDDKNRVPVGKDVAVTLAY